MYIMNCPLLYIATVRGKKGMLHHYISRSNENLKITHANVQVFLFLYHIIYAVKHFNALINATTYL